MGEIQFVWKDRKRFLGKPWSFTKYSLSEDRIFLERGILNIRQDEILLYRVRDLELRISLWQRLFGVGTVVIHSSDKSIPHLELLNIKDPREVKEMIHTYVESCKDKRRMNSMEIMGSSEPCTESD